MAKKMKIASGTAIDDAKKLSQYWFEEAKNDFDAAKED